ncbi:MAG: LPS export ABC transporter permease LptF [Gammaproteobacteria bacterium]|nr:MAG: LPS export ABC transporter permease LptF [Gammaproteobacteria bacterium]
MKILRYLNRDVLLHTLAISAVLLVVIFSGRFVKYLAQAAVGDLASDILLPVMLYRLPGFLELIVPLALFIGVLMAYGRLYVESEMVVMEACGISLGRIARYTLVPACIVMVVVASFSLYLSPLGAARSEALLNDPDAAHGLGAMTAGRFQKRGGSKVVIYAQDVNGERGSLSHVFIAQPPRPGKATQPMVTVAAQGEITLDPESGARYLELSKGYHYEGTPGQPDYRMTRFERFGQLIPEPEDGIRDAAPADGRPTSQLLRSDAPEDVAALQWRLSMPLMVPIVALLAVSLSRTSHRRGRYVNLVPALLLYLLYLLGLTKMRAALEDGAAAVPGIWWVHIVALLVALLLLNYPSWSQQRRARRYQRGVAREAA